MKSFLIAVVGLVAAADAKFTNKLNTPMVQENAKRLTKIEAEGTYFQEDSDKPREEDSMWWLNGYYQFVTDIYYGVNFVDTAPTAAAAAGNPASMTAKFGLWGFVHLIDTNEWFEWYMNTMQNKFKIMDINGSVKIAYPTAPQNDIGGATSCIDFDTNIEFFQYTSTFFQNMKRCEQSLLKAISSEEMEPICAYDFFAEASYDDSWI